MRASCSQKWASLRVAREASTLLVAIHLPFTDGPLLSLKVLFSLRALSSLLPSPFRFHQCPRQQLVRPGFIASPSGIGLLAGASPFEKTDSQQPAEPACLDKFILSQAQFSTWPVETPTAQCSPYPLDTDSFWRRALHLMVARQVLFAHPRRFGQFRWLSVCRAHLQINQ